MTVIACIDQKGHLITFKSSTRQFNRIPPFGLGRLMLLLFSGVLQMSVARGAEAITK